jgi:hypothetical protein
MQAIVIEKFGGPARGRLKARPSRVFKFEEIREAHRVMEANQGQGKDGRRRPLTGTELLRTNCNAHPRRFG